MKKLIIFIALIGIAATAYAAYEQDFRYQNAFTQKTDPVSNTMQVRMDYTGTTSGIPIYVGQASKGRLTSDENWRVYKFTDSADGPTLRQSADCAWDDRAGSCSYS